MAARTANCSVNMMDAMLDARSAVLSVWRRVGWKVAESAARMVLR
jgi:hypothetical protein